MEEKYTLYHGDCLEEMNKIPSNSIDLVLTDRPYKMTKRGNSCRPSYMGNNMGNNLFQGEIPQPEKWIENCYRVLKDGTHFYTFCNMNDITEYLYIAKNCGFKLHNIITMIKDTKMPNRWYLKYSELILFFRKGKAKKINDMTSRDYFFVNMPLQKNLKYHITEKPLNFIEKLLLNSSKENDIVLDPFMGSATTGIACINTNRKFIGIEKDDRYFKIATNRVQDNSLKIF